MSDISNTIIAKSDQLNADDLIGGRTLTITVTAVKVPGGEQPVAISYDGDGGKPYKPGKSMRRVLVQFWGADASQWVGRSMTLYRDAEVVYGGMKVGGIRISHLSDTKGGEIPLTERRGSKKTYRVERMPNAPTTNPDTPAGDPPDDHPLVVGTRKLIDQINAVESIDSLTALISDQKVSTWREKKLSPAWSNGEALIRAALVSKRAQLAPASEQEADA